MQLSGVSRAYGERGGRLRMRGHLINLGNFLLWWINLQI